VTAAGAPEQQWQGIYGTWLGAKPDVRALCSTTDGGRETVHVHHLWLSFGWFRRRHELDCVSGSVPEDLSAYCAAIAQTRLTVVQLYARPDGLPRPSLSHFNEERMTRVLSNGERQGYHCNNSTAGPDKRHCTIWLELAPSVLAVSSAWLGPRADNEDPVTDAAVVLETLTSMLRPEERN
jgi:hypothetical protein